jgi:uncharacterized membrane protein
MIQFSPLVAKAANNAPIRVVWCLCLIAATPLYHKIVGRRIQSPFVVAIRHVLIMAQVTWLLYLILEQRKTMGRTLFYLQTNTVLLSVTMKSPKRRMAA